jgi:hypothetical protein
MSIPIYMIHDGLRKDRRDLFTKELDEQGIETWEIVPAVKDSPVPRWNIAEAHKNCIRKAQARSLERVVIMEDDVMFTAPGAYNRFLELADTLPGNWDLFISGSYDASRKSVPKDNLVRIHPFSGLHCYMVNSRYYDKFLKTGGENLNIDKSLNGIIYMAFPMLALQHDTFSDNVQRVTQYNRSIKNRRDLWQGSNQ